MRSLLISATVALTALPAFAWNPPAQQQAPWPPPQAPQKTYVPRAPRAEKVYVMPAPRTVFVPAPQVQREIQYVPVPQREVEVRYVQAPAREVEVRYVQAPAAVQYVPVPVPQYVPVRAERRKPTPIRDFFFGR